MTIQQTTRLCSLERSLGKLETCPQDACPFWEPGGAVLAGHCAVDRLDVADDAVLASWLLEIRETLTASASAADEEAARSLFRHLLNDSAE